MTLKEKIKRTRILRTRLTFSWGVFGGTQRVNAVVTKEMIDDLHHITGFDIVQDMESKLVNNIKIMNASGRYQRMYLLNFLNDI